MKNRVLDLLPAFVDTDEAAMVSTLRKMSEQNFPLMSRELKFGSSAHTDYVNSFEKLASCLEQTASAQVLVKNELF